MIRQSLVVWFVAALVTSATAETLRHPPSLEQQLRASDSAMLAREARRRGNARRGALIFYKSPAACIHCHLSGADASPLGPDLATLGKLTDQHVIESLLFPSKSVRKGYETHRVLTSGGDLLVGMIVGRDDSSITLRVASDLSKDKVIQADDIETIQQSEQSMMPEGLIAALHEQRDFMDLAKYVMEVAEGGAAKAAALKPTADQLAVKDDTVGLNHAGIIKKLRDRDFESGKRIYHGYCFNCHGNDGNTPSLPTARAFGTQKLKFGADPYKMFMTLSRGNGLMAAMSHLTPKERYQVVHYVREQFMKPANPDYFRVTPEYLAGLPEGTGDGTFVAPVERDFGPALASQLRRDFSSVLTVRLGELTISYDLHTMNQAGLWRGGFLDLSTTQHARDRGEGTANPEGTELAALAGWQWGHDATLDYPTDDLLPRGPMPQRWMDYRGHYRSGDRVVLSYAIDGRSILESPRGSADSVVHSLEIGPGRELVLAIAERKDNGFGLFAGDAVVPLNGRADADASVAVAIDDENGAGDCIAATVAGDAAGMQWSADSHGRLLLHVPAETDTRLVEITRSVCRGTESIAEFARQHQQPGSIASPKRWTRGGPLMWPDELQTIGFQGLEKGAYVLDTLTLPDATPWNTWFRTSALDFFSDGRMALATYGGDIWIVSGIDQQLLNLRWKRFAGGLYEPMGVEVVDDQVYVTCKDRLVRLHDADGNGEADFYESFSADQDVSVNFHAFNFDLQTDLAGNFYYAKSGHGGDSDVPGCVIKVSSDGKRREIYCTGFRTPNGMGMLPDGRPTVSDNQGQWTPASKVSLARPGGFYGWVQTYSIPGMWAPGGGKIDLEKVVPPKSFDQPLVWMPQEFDNSSGGQLWVDDPRFGPLSGHMLHTSFGKGWMSYMMIQEIGEVSQAAIIKLPFDFRTGIMRARVNPADGQVYAVGLQGWNGGARVGLRDSGVQRLRFTGADELMVTDCQVEHDGLRISFNQTLDADSATRIDAYVAEHWNYHWTRNYGSDRYAPKTDKPGTETMTVESVSLSADGKSVKLNIPDLIPVNQAHLILRVKSVDGAPLEEEIYWTINALPSP